MLEQVIERNIIRKKWEADQMRIALIYPNRYSAMSGLTIQSLYNLWNSDPKVACERFFMPNDVFHQKKRKNTIYQRREYKNNSRMGQEYEELRSLETGMPLKSFDVAAFTICYELDIPNIFWILNNAGIPSSRKERREIVENDDEKSGEELRYPLIIIGGPVVRSNPLPLEETIDIAYIGEMEPNNANLIDAWREAFINSQDWFIAQREAFLNSLTKYNGFWIPEINKHLEFRQKKEMRGQGTQFSILRSYISNLDDAPHPINQIIPITEGEKDRLPFGQAIYVEINRGCPHLCHFCMTGYQLKPFRNRSLENLKEIILKARESTGVNKIVLIGSSVSDHPQFKELISWMANQNFEFSIPSLRIDTMDKELANLIVRGGIKTIAIAPETGNERLRKKLNKFITNEQILEGCKILKDAGIPNIKLYMLYGFPFEKDEDVQSIVDLTKEIASLGYGRSAVRLSLNPFVPKAHTPFQLYFENYLDVNMPILQHREQIILKQLQGNSQIKIITLPLKEAYLQAIISLGDEKIEPLLNDFYNAGLNYSKWFKIARKPSNQEWIQEMLNQIRENFKSHKPQAWDFIDIGQC